MVGGSGGGSLGERERRERVEWVARRGGGWGRGGTEMRGEEERAEEGWPRCARASFPSLLALLPLAACLPASPPCMHYYCPAPRIPCIVVYTLLSSIGVFICTSIVIVIVIVILIIV